MDLEFTEDQEELRASVRSFLEKECPLSLVRAVVETGEAPEKLWASMVSLDWPGLAISEDCGGVRPLVRGVTAVVVEEARPGRRPRALPGHDHGSSLP